ncbi:MAG: sulfurtransferase TusA family protein [Sedimenticolaceae bacterium]
MTEQRKALALISGGLDSLLAARVVQDQGVHVEGINFYTGFCVEGHTHAIRKKDRARPRRNNALTAGRLCMKLLKLRYHAAPMSTRHDTIDCQRLLCPMPVIRVQDRVDALSAGDTLTAVCTDPGVLQDIPAWCRINGHQLLRADSVDGEYLVTLRVGRDPG